MIQIDLDRHRISTFKDRCAVGVVQVGDREPLPAHHPVEVEYGLIKTAVMKGKIQNSILVIRIIFQPDPAAHPFTKFSLRNQVVPDR